MNDFKDINSTLPSEVKVGKLDTIEAVRNEMSRLYRAARRSSGHLPDAVTAAKLAYLLNYIGKSIEGAELEKRIKQLEVNLGKIGEQKESL